MMESLEVIVGVISRYALLEKMYCQRCATEAENKVRTSIVNVYTAVLDFLCKAYEHFTQHPTSKSSRYHSNTRYSTILL